MKFLVALLLVAIVAAKSEVHYHYHGLNPNTFDAHNGLFSSDKPNCTYKGKPSALNVFGDKEGWYCYEGPWDNCTQQCDNFGCHWVCTRVIPNKVSAAKANANAAIGANIAANTNAKTRYN